MALNATTLKNEIIAAINAALPSYSSLPNDHRLTGYSKTEYDDLLYGAIAQAIITHITTNGLVTGLDSRGDTHSLIIT